jgi:membrane protease YdiL (CAAX protease family)
MAGRNDPVRIAVHVAVYLVLYILSINLFGPLLAWLGGFLVGITTTELVGAIFANWLALRMFENRSLADAGVRWSRASADNLAMGLAGGIAAALLVTIPALAFGAARLVHVAGESWSATSTLVLAGLLACGAAGEELFFRGYGFQAVVARAGGWATVLPAGVIFGLMHARNPHSSWISVVNTAGFGILFGYAYLRSHDLWLPFGLHFGWNLSLPLLGVNVSGLTMNVTGYELSWSAGPLWSGGQYGPEASLLTGGVLVALFVYLFRAPVRRQFSPILDPPAELAVCESSPPLRS